VKSVAQIGSFAIASLINPPRIPRWCSQVRKSVNRLLCCAKEVEREPLSFEGLHAELQKDWHTIGFRLAYDWSQTTRKSRNIYETRTYGGESVIVKILEKGVDDNNEIRIIEKLADPSLAHPNIGQFLPPIEHGTRSDYVFMKCYESDLLDWMMRNGFRVNPLNPKTPNEGTLLSAEAIAAKISMQLLGAVSHLHKNGIAHRDIKPEERQGNPPPYRLGKGEEPYSFGRWRNVSTRGKDLVRQLLEGDDRLKGADYFYKLAEGWYDEQFEKCEEHARAGNQETSKATKKHPITRVWRVTRV